MRRVALALAVVASTLGVATAHETTLYPAAFAVDTGQPLPLVLSSMETFPAFQTGPRPERVARTVAWIAATQAPVTLSAHAPTALRFTLSPQRAGLGVVGISLKPRDIDLAPDKIAEYFAEIDPPAATRAALAPGADLHETYTKYAKAIVCVGACRDTRAAARVLGDALEFVPARDANGLSLRRFTLRARGAPAADIAVTVWRDGAHVILRSGANGAFALPADMHGPVMLSATILRPPATPGARFASDFATLTFEAPSP